MTDIFAGLICRPPRKEYTENDLGPARYLLQEQMCIRRDLELKNRRKMNLKCSQYLPVDSETLEVEGPVPCVIYLHGNSGSRMDADDMVDTFLAEKISVFSIDFAGCGLSDGDFVTLGWREREDLEAVLDYLAEMPHVISHVALYGRSMGAATAMLVASDDRFYHRIVGMVLDSCYASVRQVLLELADKYVGKVPLVPFSAMIEPAVDMLRQAVKQRARFDIDKVNVLEAARHCNAPVLFGHAADDQLVLASHTHSLHKEYGGPKELNVFEGDHNSIRPQDFRDQALKFLKKCFEEGDGEKRTEGPSHVPFQNGDRSRLIGVSTSTTAASALNLTVERDETAVQKRTQSLSPPPSPPPLGAGVAAASGLETGGEGGEWKTQIFAADFVSEPKKVAETPRVTPDKAHAPRGRSQPLPIANSFMPSPIKKAITCSAPPPGSPSPMALSSTAAASSELVPETPSASRAAPLAQDAACTATLDPSAAARPRTTASAPAGRGATAGRGAHEDEDDDNS